VKETFVVLKEIEKRAIAIMGVEFMRIGILNIS
jgi:hypothetical protein